MLILVIKYFYHKTLFIFLSVYLIIINSIYLFYHLNISGHYTPTLKRFLGGMKLQLEIVLCAKKRNIHANKSNIT